MTVMASAAGQVERTKAFICEPLRVSGQTITFWLETRDQKGHTDQVPRWGSKGGKLRRCLKNLETSCMMSRNVATNQSFISINSFSDIMGKSKNVHIVPKHIEMHPSIHFK